MQIHVNIDRDIHRTFHLLNTRRVGTFVWAEASPHSPHRRVFEHLGRE